MDFKVETPCARLWLRARDIGADDMDLRVDLLPDLVSYILKKGQQEGWASMGAGWSSFTELGYSFSENWNEYNGYFEEYLGCLSGWASGEWSGSVGGQTAIIYDIQVNPALDNSVFTPS